jgi:hypothetical protein
MRNLIVLGIFACTLVVCGCAKNTGIVYDTPSCLQKIMTTSDQVTLDEIARCVGEPRYRFAVKDIESFDIEPQTKENLRNVLLSQYSQINLGKRQIDPAKVSDDIKNDFENSSILVYKNILRARVGWLTNAKYCFAYVVFLDQEKNVQGQTL